jgi:hypothetical protein
LLSMQFAFFLAPARLGGAGSNRYLRRFRAQPLPRRESERLEPRHLPDPFLGAGLTDRMGTGRERSCSWQLACRRRRATVLRMPFEKVIESDGVMAHANMTTIEAYRILIRRLTRESAVKKRSRVLGYAGRFLKIVGASGGMDLSTKPAADAVE